MNIKKLLFISIFTFISTAHSVEKATLDAGFGNSNQKGTHLFNYANVCGTQLDTGDWNYQVIDLVTKNSFNYISFDLYKLTNNTLTPDVSSIVKIPVSGGSGVSFICDQVSKKSKLAIDSGDNIYLIADYKEEKFLDNGVPIQAKGIKVMSYNSNGQLTNETGIAWPYMASVGSPGYAYETTAKFTQNNNLIIVTPVIYSSLYMQPFSFEYELTNKSLSINSFDFNIEDVNLSSGSGTAINIQNNQWLQNISTSQWDNTTQQYNDTAYIRKIDTNSDIDINFGNQGNLAVNPENSSYGLYANTILNNGDVIASGYSFQLNNPYEYNTTIVKFSQDGIIDLSFGDNGYLRIPIQNLAIPPDNDYSSLYSEHKIITTNSGLNILYTNNNQTIIGESDQLTYYNSKQLVVFDNTGNIDDPITQLLNQSLYADVFTLINMKQDDFGGLIFAGNCKEGLIWLSCVKRVNWDNKTESIVAAQTGSGSISYILILALALIRIRKH